MRGSEVMRRTKVSIDEWRAATDEQREAWRRQAREQFAKEQRKAPGSIESRLSALEGKVFGGRQTAEDTAEQTGDDTNNEPANGDATETDNENPTPRKRRARKK